MENTIADDFEVLGLLSGVAIGIIIILLLLRLRQYREATEQQQALSRNFSISGLIGLPGLTLRAVAFSAGGDGGSGLLEPQEPCRDGKMKAPRRA